MSSPVTFELRFVHLDSGRIETGVFSSEPELEQAAAVLRLMREFFAGRPPQFRERLPFLKRGDIEVDWTAAAGGVAFATLYESGEPATLAVFTCDPANDAGQGVLAGLRKSFGLGAAETAPSSGPLCVAAALPGKAEWLPTMHLLNTSLAALFFHAAARRAPDAGS